MLPEMPLRNFASAIYSMSFCGISIEDFFNVIEEQMRKFVPALVITIERPHKPLSPVFINYELYLF
jgi:hypothetical protein